MMGISLHDAHMLPKKLSLCVNESSRLLLKLLDGS